MADNDQLKPNDFPVHVEKKKIVKTDGKDIAEAATPRALISERSLSYREAHPERVRHRRLAWKLCVLI